MKLDQAQKDIKYHDATAREYDSVVVEPRKVSIDALFRPLSRHLPSSRRTMLDLGCGTGHMLCRYGEAFEKVVAVDHSSEMIEIAKRNAEKAGIVKPEFAVGDAFAFLEERAAEKFDFVTCVGFLHHLEPARIEEIFVLIKRALSPQGVFVFSEPVETNFDEPKLITWWNKEYRKQPKLYSMAAEDPDEAPLRIEFLRKATAAAGLTIVGEGRGWEIFPRRRGEHFVDAVMISVLHNLFGKHGFVFWACCTAESP